MDPLDLSARPPRRPRDETRGILFLPRSIDKLRAHLPGGDPGPYELTGLTERMFDAFGTTISAMLAVAASAKTDDEIAEGMLAGAPPGAAAAWDDFITRREPLGGDRAAAIALYPFLAERPRLGLSLDVLAEDDERYFAGTKPGTTG